MVGLGGGLLIAPALVCVFRMSQHEAQGTSLATPLLLIGLFGFLEYYRRGQADIRIALLLAFGLTIGGYVGGRWAATISDVVLRRAFSAMLAIIAIRMWFER